MRKAMKYLAVTCVVLLTSCLPTFAATVNYSFSFANSTESGSGTLFTTTTATAGQYLITGISGTAEGSSITSLLAPGTYPTNPGPPNDNLLFFPAVGGAYLDYNGMSFALLNGSQVNIYYQGGYAVDTNSDNSVDFTTFTVAATPEPDSLALAGTGVLSALGFVRRRRANTTV